MICGDEQQKEIETIAERTLTLKLSDADVKRICEKAGGVGLSVSELFESFVGDLVGGTYSNGSDERMYAQQWFERCGFGMFPDYTFLHYLIEWGGLDDVMELWEDIQEGKKEIAYLEEHPEVTEPNEIAGLQEDIDYWQEQLDDYFKEYKQADKEKESGTLEEEIQKILKWQAEYKNFLGKE